MNCVNDKYHFGFALDIGHNLTIYELNKTQEVRLESHKN